MNETSKKDIDEQAKKYNKIFENFQKYDEKLANWKKLSPKTKDKWTKILAQQQIDNSIAQNNLLKEQIKTNKQYTNRFTFLTVALVIISYLSIVDQTNSSSTIVLEHSLTFVIIILIGFFSVYIFNKLN